MVSLASSRALAGNCGIVAPARWVPHVDTAALPTALSQMDCYGMEPTGGSGTDLRR
jgi:hypothetical protein